MACGCKKKQQVQETPTVKVTVSEDVNQSGVKLTPTQEEIVENISAKLLNIKKSD